MGFAGKSEGSGDGKWEHSAHEGFSLCLELRRAWLLLQSTKLSVCVNVFMCVYYVLVYEPVGMYECVYVCKCV